MRDRYRNALVWEDASYPVVKSFGNIWDLQIRAFCAERWRVFLTVLGVLCLIYINSRIPVKMEDVVKHVLVLCGCRFCGAFVFDTFLPVTNEVDLRLFWYR